MLRSTAHFSLRQSSKITAITSSSGTLCLSSARCFGGSASCALPMMPGTELKSLGIVKNEDPPVVKPREEYPAWVGKLATPLPTLAMLRRIPNEEAKDSEMARFIKLGRRQRIRAKNEEVSS